MGINKKNTFRRIVCTSLSWFLVMQGGLPSAGHAYGASPAEETQSAELLALAPHWLKNFPSEMGSIESFAAPSVDSDAPFIIHVQDIHAAPQVQEKIHELLKWITAQVKGPFVIGLEGSSGQIHPEYLDFFPDSPQINNQIADRLRDAGELTGAELFAHELYSLKQSGPEFFGVEDPQLYRANFQAYRDVFFAREALNAELALLKSDLELAKSRIFSPELNEFYRERTRRKEGDYGTEASAVQLLPYIQYLVRKSGESLELDFLDPIEQLRFPEITRILAMELQEKAFDVASADQQQKSFFQLLRASALDPDDHVRVDRLDHSPGGVFSRRNMETMAFIAAKHKIDLSKYSDFFKKAGLNVLRAEVSASSLWVELNDIERGLVRSWASTESQKNLCDFLRDFEMLEKLLELKLTREEFAEFKKGIFFSPEILADRLSSLVPNDLKPRSYPGLMRFYPSAVSFYEGAQARDKALLNRLLNHSANHSVAILVTGGFHSSGLEEEMKSLGIGYAVIQPRIAQLDSQDLLGKVFRDENAFLPGEFSKFNLTKQDGLFLRQMILAGASDFPSGTSADEISMALTQAINAHPVLSEKLQVIKKDSNLVSAPEMAGSAARPVSGKNLPVRTQGIVFALATSGSPEYAVLWSPHSGMPADSSEVSQVLTSLELSVLPRSEVRISAEEKVFNETRGKAILDYASKTNGELPLPVHPIDRFFRFKDMQLNLLRLEPEGRIHYQARALDFLTDLKSRGGHIISAVMAGGSASRMAKGKLPDLLIQALKEDPGQFVDSSRLGEKEWAVIRERFDGKVDAYIQSLNPDKEDDHEILDRVLPGAKALLPAGKIDGQWYNLLGFHLINVKRANDELQAIGLGRPFLAEVMLNDAYYPVIMAHLAEKNFYGLSVQLIRDASGKVLDVDHDARSNELLLYNQKLGYRKVAPVAVIDKIWNDESRALVEQAGRESNDKAREALLAKATFKSEAQYQYAREYSVKNEGGVLFDQAFVPGGHGDRFHARLETTDQGRKKPIYLDAIERKVEYEFFHNIDNMAMINDDWLTIFGYMLEKQLGVIFEGSARPATERGGGGGFDYRPVKLANGQTVIRVGQTEDLVTRASLKQDPVTREAISPAFNQDHENRASEEILPGSLKNQVPVNNASAFVRSAPDLKSILKGRDAISANLPEEMRPLFYQAVQTAMETGRYERLVEFANLLRQNFGMAATPKLIRNPAESRPSDEQSILTIVEETYAWDVQKGFLGDNGVDVVGTPSIVDVAERKTDPKTVRFDPLKDRPTYGVKIAQEVRESLLERVVNGNLMGESLLALRKYRSMLEFENRATVTLEEYLSAVKNKNQVDADRIEFFVNAVLTTAPENSHRYKSADYLKTQILRSQLETDSSRMRFILREYLTYAGRDDSASRKFAALIERNVASLSKAPADTPLKRNASLLLENIRKSGLEKKKDQSALWPFHEPAAIAVIGLGFVGSAKAITDAVIRGHRVIGVDVNQSVVKTLSDGKMIHYMEGMEPILKEGISSGRLSFTTNYKDAVEKSRYIFLAIDTPADENTGEANTRNLERAVRSIVENLKDGEERILITKSTAPPSLEKRLKRIAAEEIAKREFVVKPVLHFAREPEFLREGKELEDLLGASGRIVIGADDPGIANEVKSLYEFDHHNPNYPVENVKIVMTDLASAPLVKYAANGYRGLKISFINYVGRLAESVGLNVQDVADAIGADERIVRDFLNCGIGFGGSCFPKDFKAYVQIARQAGVPYDISLDALAVNEFQWHDFYEKINDNIEGRVRNKKIVVLGAAFKPQTSDVREARSRLIIERLLADGANVVVHDPVATKALRDFYFRNDSAIEYSPTVKEAETLPVDKLQERAAAVLPEILADADAIVLVTEWGVYKNIDFKALKDRILASGVRKSLPPLFDGRNLWDPRKLKEAGFEEYFSVGRSFSDKPLVKKEEFIKYTREFFLALRISFINQLAEVAEKNDANVLQVIEGLGLDPVVAKFYLRDKYLSPGLGFGGHNLPDALNYIEKLTRQHLSVDLQKYDLYRRRTLEHFGIDAGADPGAPYRVPFVDSTREINDRQIELYFQKIKFAAGGDIKGKVVAVLGASFKKGEYTITNSPALKLAAKLMGEGAVLRLTDPNSQARVNAQRYLKLPEAQIFATAEEAVTGSDVQVLATHADLYKDLGSILVDETAGPRPKTLKVVAPPDFLNPEVVTSLGADYLTVGISTPGQIRSEIRQSAIAEFRRDLTPSFVFSLALQSRAKDSVLSVPEDRAASIRHTAREALGGIYSLETLSALFTEMPEQMARSAGEYALSFVVREILPLVEEIPDFTEAERKVLPRKWIDALFKPAVETGSAKKRFVIAENLKALPDLDRLWLRHLAVHRDLVWQVDIDNVSESDARLFLGDLLKQARVWGFNLQPDQIILLGSRNTGFDSKLIGAPLKPGIERAYLATESGVLKDIPNRPDTRLRVLKGESLSERTAARLAASDFLRQGRDRDPFQIFTPAQILPDYQGLLNAIKALASIAASA